MSAIARIPAAMAAAASVSLLPACLSSSPTLRLREDVAALRTPSRLHAAPQQHRSVTVNAFWPFTTTPAYSRKDNAVFVSLVTERSPKLFLLLKDRQAEFQKKVESLFPASVEGAKIDAAVQELYRYLQSVPAAKATAEALMAEAAKAPGDDSIADDLTMARLAATLGRSIARGPPDASRNFTKNFVTLPLFIATNRNVLEKVVTKGLLWGTIRSKQVSFGEVRVSLPNSFSYGSTKGGSWSYSDTREGPDASEIVVESSVIMKEDAWMTRLKTIRAAVKEKEAVVFVHGYNSNALDACQSAAHIVYSGNFQAPCFVFSWPSNSTLNGYTADEANVMWALEDFMSTLTKLKTELGIEKVHLFGHSMGSRLVLYSLRMQPNPEVGGLPKIGQVVLAAPDFDRGEFSKISPSIAKNCEGVTLYNSQDDMALDASEVLHGNPRLGDFDGIPELAAKKEIPKLQKLVAIDTANIDNTFLGHNYVFNVSAITVDCALVLRFGLPPTARTSLEKKTLADGQDYWALKDVAENPILLREATAPLEDFALQTASA